MAIATVADMGGRRVRQLPDRTLGRRIRKRREEQHLAQAGCAALTRPPMSQESWSKIERGLTVVGTLLLAEIARVLETTRAALNGEAMAELGIELPEDWEDWPEAQRAQVRSTISGVIAVGASSREAVDGEGGQDAPSNDGPPGDANDVPGRPDQAG